MACCRRNRRSRFAARSAYDVDFVERITATVLTVGSVWVGSEYEERLALRVRTTDGRDRIVHGAPSHFGPQAALGLRSGRVVEITGAPVEENDSAVLVAASIAVEGRTARLRDAHGGSLWETK